MPTPTAQGFEQDEGTWRARRERQKARGVNGNGFGLTLGMAAQELDTLLRTPRASRGSSSTENAEALLPTVTAQAAKHAGDEPADEGRNLWTMVPRLLPTPRTSDSKGTGEHGDGGMDLRTAVGGLTGRPSPGGSGSSDGQLPLPLTTGAG